MYCLLLPNKLTHSTIGVSDGLNEKEIVELNFQKKFVLLYKNPENKEKVREYWIKYRYLNELQELIDFKNSDILDVCCGIGTVLNIIDGKKKTAIDQLADEYKKIADYQNINLIKSYAEKLPFLNNEFDVVFCSNALDHTEKPGVVLKEIFRVLKDRGKLILTCEIFDEGYERDIAHPHSFTATKLIYLLRDFKIIFLKTSPWIGMTNYILGNREYQNMEWVIVAQKENKKI